MTTQTQTTEERLSKLEGVYEQVNERLRDLTEGQAALRASLEAQRAELHAEIADLRAEIRQVEAALRAEIRQVDSNLRAEIGKLRSEMHRQTYLIIGVIGGLVTLLRFIG